MKVVKDSYREAIRKQNVDVEKHYILVSYKEDAILCCVNDKGMIYDITDGSIMDRWENLDMSDKDIQVHAFHTSQDFLMFLQEILNNRLWDMEQDSSLLEMDINE